ncbi:hypothetical protein JIN84_07890 [Luteolibacter yonseiensis]|uniref:Uncharacterized protein n=1 Tax=Luteolibacter yonseiensis TaxID=1144680 RepID=A0A934R223_9BACT|nr:hypothetical protein [Luteolibacter yonseiensis]MBK1815531.1 hypothetical protein [Luteolibacter yonseiensis]
MGNSPDPSTDFIQTGDDHHFRREDRVCRWQRISGHIAEHPEELAIVLGNIDRWLALGRVHPAPLHEWRERIHAARRSPDEFRAFLDFLSAPNHDTERIKSCSPFVGLTSHAGSINKTTWESETGAPPFVIQPFRASFGRTEDALKG